MSVLSACLVSHAPVARLDPDIIEQVGPMQVRGLSQRQAAASGGALRSNRLRRVVSGEDIKAGKQ